MNWTAAGVAAALVIAAFLAGFWVGYIEGARDVVETFVCNIGVAFGALAGPCMPEGLRGMVLNATLESIE